MKNRWTSGKGVALLEVKEAKPLRGPGNALHLPDTPGWAARRLPL